jgi:hypothetical protein
MELQTIEMPKAEARKAFLEYRHAVRERHDAEDEQIMRAYRALSQGKPVIDIFEAIRDGGRDRNGLPKLAIARADAVKTVLLRRPDGSFHMAPINLTYQDGSIPGRAEYRGRVFRFPVNFLTPKELRFGRERWVAMNPTVPPALRPQHAMSNYHVLWEAEWRKDPVPPRDPALLKHLGGPLYMVLATWDLTDVERAVLGVTRR